MKKTQILLFGTGGQGIKTMGDILGRATFYDDLWPYVHSSYTPATRGGDIISSVVISEQEEEYPFVEIADWIFILAPSESLEALISMIGEEIGEKTRFVTSREIIFPSTIDEGNVIRIDIKRDIYSLNMFILGVIQVLLSEIKTASIELAMKEVLSENFDRNMESFREGQRAISS